MEPYSYGSESFHIEEMQRKTTDFNRVYESYREAGYHPQEAHLLARMEAEE